MIPPQVKLGDKPLSKNDLEKYLSKTECPKSNSQQSQDEAEAQDQLPVIDLFLNPKRKGELRKLQQLVEEKEAAVTYTEVYMHDIYIDPPVLIFTPGGTVPDLSQPFPASLAFNAALLPSGKLPR